LYLGVASLDLYQLLSINEPKDNAFAFSQRKRRESWVEGERYSEMIALPFRTTMTTV
jgi:hypothetical protein